MADNKEDSEQISEGAKRIIARAEEAARKREKDLDKFVTPLKPSQETQLLLDREAGFLSEKARKLFQSQAYFFERSTDTFIGSVKNKRPEVLMEEDKEEINRALDWLELDYSDYLELSEEFQAGKDVIKSLKDTVDIMRKNNQPVFITWFNLAKRISEFQQNIISNEAKDSVEQQRIVLLNNNLQNYIFSRIPVLLPSPTQRLSTFQEKLSKISEAVESNLPREEVESYFDELDDYMEQDYNYDSPEIHISRSQASKWRQRLISLVEEKGVTDGTLTNRGKRILLKGEEIRVLFGTEEFEIWYPGGDLPIHLTAVSLGEGSKPHYIKIEEDGGVRTGVNYYTDDPESVRQAEETRKILPDQWEKFIKTALEQAEKYSPT